MRARYIATLPPYLYIQYNPFSGKKTVLFDTIPSLYSHTHKLIGYANRRRFNNLP